MYSPTILEEELKNKVAKDFFAAFDTTAIVGKIDFSVSLPQSEEELRLYDTQFFLWAEAKKGHCADINTALTQLVITIGKARTFNTYLPPFYLGAFDAERIVFVAYEKIQDIFYQNDFNWNVTPSDHTTKEFECVYQRIQDILNAAGEVPLLYDFEKDKKLLQKFIKSNFCVDNAVTHKVRVTFSNMTSIFNRWLEEVKPSIEAPWEAFEKENILACDFFLADVLAKNNQTLSDSMKVLLRDNMYLYQVSGSFGGQLVNMFSNVAFNDNQKRHTLFWARYERPPQKHHREQMRERRDLLVPPDRRERKGAFFTPSRWVDLSQKYLADVLGEDWQDNYFIWDCCAGTGNLLYGLYNKPYIFASTLDDADVRQMKENCSNLLSEHIFQFDFLNDDLQDAKVPADLRRILSDPELRKKLVIYINPPYVEAASKDTLIGKGESKKNVAVSMKTYGQYLSQIGIAGRELFAQFFIRIYCEIPGTVLADFSTLKILQAPNFVNFRSVFKAKLESLFLVPANTFDNVKGQFPIGFHIWDTSIEEPFKVIKADVYGANRDDLGNKKVCVLDNKESINDWIISTRNRYNEFPIAFMVAKGCDFQTQNLNYIVNDKTNLPHPRGTWVTNLNLKEIVIYYAVRHCIDATWLNDRDQFLYPNDGWKTDNEFQSDCLAYTLFNNNIQSKYGINHWIPFRENEVGARGIYESHFMIDYIAGKIQAQTDLFAMGNENHSEKENVSQTETPIQFSASAQIVMNAGRALYSYYHSQPNANPNASFYDIRLYFQGIDEKGRMNSKSEDTTYNTLLATLRTALKVLALKIEPKVYKYGFLLGDVEQTTNSIQTDLF